MDNVQFATAVHVLTLLASTEESLSSGYMAGSMNVNAAVVRKMLGTLREQGLVETKEGKGGGAVLARPATQILLSDVYRAVNSTALLGRVNSPNPDCAIGKQINGHLEELYNHADAALIGRLSGITLADFCKKFR